MPIEVAVHPGGDRRPVLTVERAGAAARLAIAMCFGGEVLRHRRLNFTHAWRSGAWERRLSRTVSG